jgi:hypothetical protein
MQGRLEGLRHRQPAEQLVAALVLDLGHRRLEPDGEEQPGEQQDDERVQRDLAQQEGPVIGEDLAQGGLADLRDAEAFVQPADGAGTVVSVSSSVAGLGLEQGASGEISAGFAIIGHPP